MNTKAFYAQCKKCSHIFKVCDLPMEVEEMGRVGREACCPDCGCEDLLATQNMQAIEAARAAGALGSAPGTKQSVLEAQDVLPANRILKVEMTFALPAAATKTQIEEWVLHTIGQTGALGVDNPLYEHEPEMLGDDVLLEDTGERLTSKASDLSHGRTRVQYFRSKDTR